MDGRRRPLRGGIVAAAVFALGLAGCSAVVSRPAFDCDGVPSAACTGAMLAARDSLPLNVAARPLVGATVRSVDPTDPVLCHDHGVCEVARWAAIVELTVPGPDGITEAWPVAVIQRQPGDSIVAPKPFPGSSQSR